LTFRHLNKFAKGVKTGCLYHFDEPVSPHLAVERSREGDLRVPTDREFVKAVGGYVRGFAEETKGERSSLYIESAGGEFPNLETARAGNALISKDFLYRCSLSNS